MAYESFDNINQHELQAVIEAEINLFENTRSTITYQYGGAHISTTISTKFSTTTISNKFSTTTATTICDANGNIIRPEKENQKAGQNQKKSKK